MACDGTLKRQLIEARENIVAQLDELEFRATAKGISGTFGGPPIIAKCTKNSVTNYSDK